MERLQRLPHRDGLAPQPAVPASYESLCQELRQQAELAEVLSRTLRTALDKARELVECMGEEPEMFPALARERRG
jgi:hypothetical protein